MIHSHYQLNVVVFNFYNGVCISKLLYIHHSLETFSSSIMYPNILTSAFPCIEMSINISFPRWRKTLGRLGTECGHNRRIEIATPLVPLVKGCKNEVEFGLMNMTSKSENIQTFDSVFIFKYFKKKTYNGKQTIGSQPCFAFYI